MTQTLAMLQSSPPPPMLKQDLLAPAIDALVECSQVCTACADACLAEVDLRKLLSCIRFNLDCADICSAASRVLSRQVDPDRQTVYALLQATASACALCGAECSKHAEHMEHCRLCAEACQAAENHCNQLLQEYQTY